MFNLFYTLEFLITFYLERVLYKYQMIKMEEDNDN